MGTKDKAWQVVNSKYLSRRPWLTVRCDDMPLPSDNHIPRYYIPEYPDWVNTIAITREEKFVFVRQLRSGIGKQLYEPCVGVCEREDAPPFVSTQRELLEKTGYGNGSWQEYMVIPVNLNIHTNLTHCFPVTDVEWVDIRYLGDVGSLIVHLLTFEEVQELLKSNQIIQVLYAAPFWKYATEQKQTK